MLKVKNKKKILNAVKQFMGYRKTRKIGSQLLSKEQWRPEGDGIM
jgi:hypothetical protein